MSKVILHIGTHKTATTTIQNTLAHNAPLLAQHGVVYPRLKRAPGHHGLVPEWPAMPKAYQLPDGPLDSLKALADEYAQTDQTLVLSSEEFSRAASLEHMGTLREILSGFDQIEVICVLRTQWQYLQSIYLEMSKKRRVARPPQFVGPVVEKGKFGQLWVDYNGLLDQLEQVFTPEEITLYDFTQCRQAEGGILGVFLRHLGLPLTAQDLEPVNGGVANVSPMSLASFAANVLAEPKVAPDWLVEKAAAQLRSQFGAGVKPCLFTRNEFQTLEQAFAPANARLAERRAAVQPGFAISAPDAEALSLFRNDISGAFWMKMARSLTAELLDS